MQLVIVGLALFFLVWSSDVKAQILKQKKDTSFDYSNQSERLEMDSSTYSIERPQVIEVDFLSSYYLQDGNNSAVTGGEGTEKLSDFTSKIILKVPLSKQLSINVDAGFDFYTSESTDMIDNNISSDSLHDSRIHGNIGVSYKMNEQHSVGVRVGLSKEYDYTSFNAGFNYNWLSKDQNTSIGLAAQAFIDQWKLYFPKELRNQGALVPTNKRQSYNASLSISRVLNKRLQMSIQLEGVYMTGLLSTPFHRVFFKNQAQAKVEQLPSTRLKLPIGVRLNYHLSEHLIARLYYRYYWDNWGVQAHTASVELPIKITRFLSVYPFYRYHTQTAADYFSPKQTHDLSQEFFTSDYDLSAFDSHSYGLGLRYSPAHGIARAKIPFTRRTFIFKSIDLKYSHYDRSTGLKADIISLGISFNF